MTLSKFPPSAPRRPASILADDGSEASGAGRPPALAPEAATPARTGGRFTVIANRDVGSVDVLAHEGTYSWRSGRGWTFLPLGAISPVAVASAVTLEWLEAERLAAMVGVVAGPVRHLRLVPSC